ncbi:MAG: acyl dehydratase [Comamonadaceae bacterium]|nr:MAG: acyl dehydratase [Comamonadaceae bacterium]
MPELLPPDDIYWDDLSCGTSWTTRARTITEGEVVAFVNLAWLTEALFTDRSAPFGPASKGRLVPGSLVYAMAEGLTLSAVKILGFALLNTELDIKAPTYAGDTIHVRSEVIGLDPTRKPDRGRARTRNDVINQHGGTVMVYTALRMVTRRGAP